VGTFAWVVVCFRVECRNKGSPKSLKGFGFCLVVVVGGCLGTTFFLGFVGLLRFLSIAPIDFSGLCFGFCFLFGLFFGFFVRLGKV